jgi:VWFA-related protein
MNDFKICEHCGEKLYGYPRFCSGCGQRIPDEVIEEVSEEVPEDGTEKMQEENTWEIEVEDCIIDQHLESFLEGKRVYKTKKPYIVIGIIIPVACLVLALLFIRWGGYFNKKVSAQNVKIKVNQIDNQSFPLMKLYVSILDDKDESIDKLPLDYFLIREKLKDSNDYISQKAQSVNQLEMNQSVSINLVMDTSASMKEHFKLENTKAAAISFINLVNDSTQLEILEFNDFVRTKTDFTNNKKSLIDAVSQLYSSGQKALYDSMYTALLQTSSKEGAKCVIVFTDGKSNKDTKSKQEVIDFAKKTGIPIYTIGIGNDVESEVLTDISMQTGGYYVNTPTASELEAIYKNIFKIQKRQYVITYTSNNVLQENNWRNVELSISNDKYVGVSSREYTSQIIKPSLATFDMAKIDKIIRTNAGNGVYSVIIKDLSNGEESRAGEYKQKMSASSLVNVPITLTIAEMIRNGRLTLNSKIPFQYTVGGRGKFTRSNNGELHTVDELMKAMMNYSDNNCTNTFLSFLGINEINNIVHSYGFTETEIQRPLLVTDGNKENWTTCEEIAKMLELLYSDSLPIGSAYLNENFKIIDSSKEDGILKYLPANIFALHHNGVTSDIYNEIAFIGNGSKKYILTVFSYNEEKDKLAETTALISKYVYDEMLK